MPTILLDMSSVDNFVVGKYVHSLLDRIQATVTPTPTLRPGAREGYADPRLTLPRLTNVDREKMRPVDMFLAPFQLTTSQIYDVVDQLDKMPREIGAAELRERRNVLAKLLKMFRTSEVQVALREAMCGPVPSGPGNMDVPYQACLMYGVDNILFTGIRILGLFMSEIEAAAALAKVNSLKSDLDDYETKTDLLMKENEEVRGAHNDLQIEHVKTKTEQQKLKGNKKSNDDGSPDVSLGLGYFMIIVFLLFLLGLFVGRTMHGPECAVVVPMNFDPPQYSS